jgi:hypothetical protein
MEVGKCPNCHQNYNFLKTVPKVLPCGHSLCSQCVDSMIQMYRGIACVECPYRSNGPIDITANLSLLKTLSALGIISKENQEIKFQNQVSVQNNLQTSIKFATPKSRASLSNIIPRSNSSANIEDSLTDFSLIQGSQTSRMSYREELEPSRNSQGFSSLPGTPRNNSATPKTVSITTMNSNVQFSTITPFKNPNNNSTFGKISMLPTSPSTKCATMNPNRYFGDFQSPSRPKKSINTYGFVQTMERITQEEMKCIFPYCDNQKLQIQGQYIPFCGMQCKRNWEALRRSGKL